MSFLSTSENVGGISQNISDASCATQYKMAVEGVSGCGSEVNMFIHDSSGDEQTYIPHLNDNFFHTKFKIDPNELYTFHDSDVIAGEITVSHTEDNFIFDSADVKEKFLDSSSKELDLIGALTNGEVKEEIKEQVISNGHYSPILKTSNTNCKDTKTKNTKVLKSQSQVSKELSQTNFLNETRRSSVHSPKGQSSGNGSSSTVSSKASISSVNTNHTNPASLQKCTGNETFLDVFKREQGLVENAPVVIKTESPAPSAKISVPTPKKTSSGKPSSQAKVRRGRGPAVHEALQRIPPRRAVPLPNCEWHAPGDELFQCGPLDNKRPNPFKQFESSSSDDDNMPEFDLGSGLACVEETAAESRGARLALRRAALRRQVARADTALRLTKDYKQHRLLATLIKKQLNNQGSVCRLPPDMINHLLASRGMTAVLSSQERRTLRRSGWSGGESGSLEASTRNICAEDGCKRSPLPCGRYCLAHVTLAPEQRLYAACAAVFAGGARCQQPLLPLQDQTPLCPEHAWKRDNYDKISRDAKPKKTTVRKRVCPAVPRRAKRRRRPLPRHRPPQPPVATPSLSEINVCSNSSTYDSSEDTAMGGLSDNEFIAAAGNSHELEVGEVCHVPADDILDPAVLSQIPDEAFTEFFNQAEGGGPFAESSELAAALEAVLDERALDNIADCVFTTQTHVNANANVNVNVVDNSGVDSNTHRVKTKMQIPTSLNTEMLSSEPS